VVNPSTPLVFRQLSEWRSMLWKTSECSLSPREHWHKVPDSLWVPRKSQERALKAVGGLTEISGTYPYWRRIQAMSDDLTTWQRDPPAAVTD